MSVFPPSNTDSSVLANWIINHNLNILPKYHFSESSYFAIFVNLPSFEWYLLNHLSISISVITSSWMLNNSIINIFNPFSILYGDIPLSQWFNCDVSLFPPLIINAKLALNWTDELLEKFSRYSQYKSRAPEERKNLMIHKTQKNFLRVSLLLIMKMHGERFLNSHPI